MRCPKCDALSHLNGDQCVACGADLFSPVPQQLASTGLMFLAMGGFLCIVFLTMDVTDDSAYTGRNGFLFFAIYTLFGKWPPIITLWIIGAVYLFRALRNPNDGEGTNT